MNKQNKKKKVDMELIGFIVLCAMLCLAIFALVDYYVVFCDKNPFSPKPTFALLPAIAIGVCLPLVVWVYRGIRRSRKEYEDQEEKFLDLIDSLLGAKDKIEKEDNEKN